MRRLWFVTLIAIGLILFGVSSAHAQSVKTSVDNLDVTINLQTNGTAAIVQRLQFDQPESLDWEIFSNYQKLVVATQNGAVKNLHQISAGQQTRLTSATVAQSWIISYQSSDVLIRHNDRDQLYYKIAEQSGRQIYNFTAHFTLPGKISAGQLSGNIYAIDGVINPVTSIDSPNNITFKLPYAGPSAIVTVSASWPTSVLHLSWYTNLKLSILNLNAVPWIVVGILLPLIGLFVLIDLTIRQRRSEKKPHTMRDKPPRELSPILVGVLVNKKIHPNEIAALLVDLCQRGYLLIIKKRGKFMLVRRKQNDEHLQSWEADILNQLFAGHGAELSAGDSEGVSSQELFSPEVGRAVSRVYQVVTSIGYFAENPHLTRIRYKLGGLILYFIGVIGLVVIAVSNLPAYLLLPLGALIVIAWLIFRLTPNFAHYNQVGFAERQNWLEFGNYLSLSSPVPVRESLNRDFERYLPYAVALHRTEKWASRFDRSNQISAEPDWFVSYEQTSAQEFTKELLEFINSFSRELAKLKGPLVN